MDGIVNHFPGRNALERRLLRMQSQKFSGYTPAEAPSVLGPRHKFLLGSPAFTFFLFYETTIVPGQIVYHTMYSYCVYILVTRRSGVFKTHYFTL